MASLLQSYVKWVRGNAESAASFQRLTRTFALITVDPHNLVSCELSWALVDLHAFSNTMILATAGRRVRFSERITIIAKTIRELECLVELLLRRFAGHQSAWRGLLALQSVKCLLDLLVHRQLFLVPWIWAAARRWMRVALQWVRRTHSSLSSPEANDSVTVGAARDVAETVFGPANAPLVIPRVAARRMHHCSAVEDAHNARIAESDEESAGKSLPCTGLDVLGLVVDIVMLLRPLLILFCAQRVFPKGPAAQVMADNAIHAVPAVSGRSEGMVLLDAVMRDGAAASLMPNWGVWLSFAGLDAVLALLARYIRRYRVPVVYINDASEDEMPEDSGAAVLSIAGGENPSAGREEIPTGNNGIHNGNGIVNNNGIHNGTTAVASSVPVVSRDSLRVQQSLRNLALSLLRDPFFPAVLQKPLHDMLVAGRINRIPILGPLLGYQVAHFLCKQHCAFMYSLGM